VLDTRTLGSLRGFGLCLCRCGHKRYQRVPDCLLHRVLCRAVERHVIDDRADHDAAAHELPDRVTASPGLSRRSRSGWHKCPIIGTAGTIPAMTMWGCHEFCPSYNFRRTEIHLDFSPGHHAVIAGTKIGVQNWPRAGCKIGRRKAPRPVADGAAINVTAMPRFDQLTPAEQLNRLIERATRPATRTVPHMSGQMCTRQDGPVLASVEQDWTMRSSFGDQAQ
jgi:hypothetical protein